MYLTEYVATNWILILVLLGFTVSLISTVFLDKKTIGSLYALIAEVFLLSIAVFAEFKLAEGKGYIYLRLILMAIRYSATPLILLQILMTIVRKQRWFIVLPAVALTILDIISIFSGIVFGLNDNGKLVRGPLGMLPFIIAGLYCAYLVLLLIKHGAKQSMELVPILFFAFAFASGIILPFIIGSDYAQVFCSTIAVSMFVYYVFSILQLTKRDSLTGLLNRHAYYADITSDPELITAMISVDMNGLKTINDNEGHVAGDEALATLAKCFLRAAKSRHHVYRVGGDEFVIVCRRSDESDVMDLCSRIRSIVSETKYSCSVGYCYTGVGEKCIDDVLKVSDENMYAEKERYYRESGVKRR